MILLDNIIFGMQNKGGVSRFWAGLLNGLAEQPNIAYIEHPDSLSNIYRNKLQLSTIFKDIPIPIKFLRYFNIGGLYGYKKKYDYKVFHSSYYRISKEPGVKNITTVLDFIFERYATGVALWIHKYQKRKALYGSDCLICISENTKKDLLHFYPECASKDIRVIPVGVSEYYNLSKTDNFIINGNNISPRSYFLYIGLRSGYKGFERIYSVFESMPNIKLIVVGPAFSSHELLKMTEYACQDKIINIGTVDDTDLNTLYSNAEFYFCPSSYEGFGIPLVEAMKSSCPVIASNSSSIPEVVGNAALLFNPESTSELNGVLQNISDDSIRASLITKGEKQALKFTWQSVVKQYVDIYAEYCAK